MLLHIFFFVFFIFCTVVGRCRSRKRHARGYITYIHTNFSELGATVYLATVVPFMFSVLRTRISLEKDDVFFLSLFEDEHVTYYCCSTSTYVRQMVMDGMLCLRIFVKWKVLYRVFQKAITRTRLDIKLCHRQPMLHRMTYSALHIAEQKIERERERNQVAISRSFNCAGEHYTSNLCCVCYDPASL